MRRIQWWAKDNKFRLDNSNGQNTTIWKKRRKRRKVKDEGEEERREEKGGRVTRRSLLPWDKESDIASIINIFFFVDYNVM